MKGKLIAEQTWTTHPNHGPPNIINHINANNTKQFINEYKKIYYERICKTIEMTKDFQKFEWDINIEFTHNADEVMLAHILEEEVHPYYGFNICIKQYEKIKNGKKYRTGRTRKRGMIGHLRSEMQKTIC